MDNTTGTDKIYMQRCIDLARNGELYTMPNPMVGSVIVFNGKVIGEGYHAKYGGPHAEVNAINSVKNKELLKESTLYVNLEPCAHYGKTPPCASLIASHKVKRVVIGHVDPHEKVAGKGIEILRGAGCDIETGTLEKECRELNRMFILYHEKKRPYVILKWAESADGFIDKLRNDNDPIGPNWITNEKSRQLVHKWRARCQAIMVGANTLKKDNPGLNVRSWPGINPLRAVIDTKLDIPAGSAVFNNKSKTIVFNFSKNSVEDHIEYILFDKEKPLLSRVMEVFYQKKIISLFVEGGASLIRDFIDQGYWDEARVFRGNTRFNRGIDAPNPPHAFRQCETVFDTQLIRMYPKTIF